MVAYRIGRGTANDIVVDDSSVSRCHAELRVSDDRILLLDLGSTNGTCVRENGRWIEIEKATVANDERVLLGEVVTTVSSLIARQAESQIARRDQGRRDPPLAVRQMAAAERTTPDGGGRAAEPDPQERSEAPVFGGEGGDHARLLGRIRRPRRDASRATPKREPDPPSRDPISHDGIAARVNGPARPSDDPNAESAEGESPSLIIGRPPAAHAPAGSAHAEFHPGGPDRATTSDGSSLRPAARRSTPYIDVDRGPAPMADAALPGPRVEAPSGPRGDGGHRSGGLALRLIAGGRGARRAGLGAAAVMLLAVCAVVAVRYGETLGGLLDFSAASSGRIAAAKPTDPTPAGPVATTTSETARDWRRFIGGPSDDTLAAAARYEDGSVIMVGTATVGEPRHADLWTVKLDADGKLLWRRAFGDGTADHGLAVAAGPDGGALVAGTAENRNAAWLIRLDAKGEKLWDRKIRAGARSFVTAAVAAPNGGFAALVVSRGASGSKAHTALVRFDSNGEELWRRLLKDGEVWGTDLIAIRDTGFAVAGTSTAAGEGSALWIARLDSTGEPVWARTLNRDGRDARAYLRLARRDDLIAATTHLTAERSENGGTLRLVRLDRDGKTMWDHRVKTEAGLEVTGMFLVKGAMIVSATADAGQQGLQTPWIARIDTDGRVAWRRRFTNLKGARAAAIAERRDGNILLAGHIQRGEARGRDGMMLFLSRDGRPAR